MSSFVDSLGKFDPNAYKNNGTGNNQKQRMAGDYMSEFAKTNAENNKEEFSYEGNNGKTYNTNTEKMLFGNTKQSSSDSDSSSSSAKMQTDESVKQANAKKFQASQDKMYADNLKTIANYKGENGLTSTATGANYNSDLMSGIYHDMAVKQNKDMDARKATKASIAAGNDHGSGDYKAPNSKEYYDYLKTYNGPKSYQDVVNTNQSSAIQMGLDKSEPRAYDTWTKWVKDTEGYNKAWGGSK